MCSIDSIATFSKVRLGMPLLSSLRTLHIERAFLALESCFQNGRYTGNATTAAQEKTPPDKKAERGSVASSGPFAGQRFIAAHVLNMLYFARLGNQRAHKC